MLVDVDCLMFCVVDDVDFDVIVVMEVVSYFVDEVVFVVMFCVCVIDVCEFFMVVVFDGVVVVYVCGMFIVCDVLDVVMMINYDLFGWMLCVYSVCVLLSVRCCGFGGVVLWCYVDDWIGFVDD